MTRKKYKKQFETLFMLHLFWWQSIKMTLVIVHNMYSMTDMLCSCTFHVVLCTLTVILQQ